MRKGNMMEGSAQGKIGIRGVVKMAGVGFRTDGIGRIGQEKLLGVGLSDSGEPEKVT